MLRTVLPLVALLLAALAPAAKGAESAAPPTAAIAPSAPAAEIAPLAPAADPSHWPIARPITESAPSPAAPGPAATPAEAAPSPGTGSPAETITLLDYVPEDACLAVHVRMDQLARSGLWKKIAAPQAGAYRKFLEDCPLNVDPEKDVAAAVLFVWPPGSAALDESAGLGIVLEMARDADPAALLKRPAKAHAVAGLRDPVYWIGEHDFLFVPAPRIVVFLSADFDVAGKYVAGAAKLARNAAAGPPGGLPLAPLAAPGEITFTLAVPPALKDLITAQYEKYLHGVLRANLGADELMQFAINYNLVRLALQTETACGSLDLSRSADALRAEVRFAARQMAPFMVAVLQAMADPLQMGLPALAGGAPLEEAPPEPFYLARADGAAVHITMPRAAVERLADRLLGAAGLGPASQTSAEHLRTIGAAVAAYVARKHAYPQNWSELTKAGLLPDSGVFENPALATHLTTGDYELVPLTVDAARHRPEMKVLAYEVWPRDARPPGLNVLFADGTVQHMDYRIFEQLYRQTIEGLGH
jgi:hypothetical protein